jgi:hypothetical protein
MKAKATQPFNAHGIIAERKGQELEITDPTVMANLLTMGFVKIEEPKKAKAPKTAETDKQMKANKNQ